MKYEVVVQFSGRLKVEVEAKNSGEARVKAETILEKIKREVDIGRVRSVIIKPLC